MTQATGREVSKTDQKALAALYADTGLEERAGEAQEGLTQDDYATPFLALLQSSSPQCKKSDPRCVEDAEEGMFFNTVEKQLYGTEITVIPVAYRRSFIEWKTREDGGGFIGEHRVGSEPETVVDDKNRDIIKESGHELKDTRYWYVFVLNEDGTHEPAVIGMSRTQIKPSRALQNLVAKNIWPDGKQRSAAPPSYVWSYNAKSVPQQNDEYSFWNWEFKRGEPVMSAEIIEAAKVFHDSVKEGKIREATDSLKDTESGDAGSSSEAGKGSY